MLATLEDEAQSSVRLQILTSLKSNQELTIMVQRHNIIGTGKIETLIISNVLQVLKVKVCNMYIISGLKYMTINPT